MNAVRAAARLLVYPVLMLGSLGLLWALLAADASIAWAPYLTVALVGPLVLLAERLIPYRADWLPSLSDLVDDGLFLAAVQVALPLALGYAAALLLRDWLTSAGLTLGLWPHAWPIWAQLILKIVSGDFLRYWLHRLAHTWTPLWRLHQVHHHPDKLYTTNVFRFHPAEKGLQFLCDTLPFLFLGVGREVLGYYFVFYAISGLLQHANCDVRLGFLNYLVSGPEVHRWHHSRAVAESNNNYAHSFVVWDLAFGTYFLPARQQVETLGLIEPEYPRGFLQQMLAPFRPREG